MTDKIFNSLWADALATADRDAYVSDGALSIVWMMLPEMTFPPTGWICWASCGT